MTSLFSLSRICSPYCSNNMLASIPWRHSVNAGSQHHRCRRSLHRATNRILLCNNYPRHHRTFSSLSSKKPKEDDVSTSGATQQIIKPPQHFFFEEKSSNNDKEDDENLSLSFWRLVEVSKKEWALIAMSASTLAITSSVTLLLPYCSGMVIDYTVASGNDGTGYSPVVMASGLFGLTALAGGGVYLRTLWLARAGNRVVARLKQKLFGSILQQETAFLQSSSTLLKPGSNINATKTTATITTGDLISRLTSDAQLVQAAVTTQAVAGLRQIVMSTGSAAMLIYTSPLLAAISCATLPPVFIVTRRYGRKLAKQQQHVQELLGDATSLAEQSLSNVDTVKQFVAEEYESNRFRNSIAKAHYSAVQIAHQQAILETGAHIAGNAAILVVLGFGGNLVLQGSLSAGDLTGFVMYSLLLAGNLSGLTNVYGDLVRAVAASNRIFEIVDRTPAIRSASWRKNQDGDSRGGGGDDDPLQEVDNYPRRSDASSQITNTPKGNQTTEIVSPTTTAPAASIEIKNLNFSYPARPDARVLNNFNLTVSPGEVLSLVGGSGSGKSTVGNLLTRLYDPIDDEEDSESQILINGQDIQDYDVEELRRMVGIVSQDPALVQGTIRDNIAYGEWDRLSEEQIQRAATQAHVMEFVNAFPNGLDTMVGPRGMQLSGGQRQRIALARCIAKNPTLMILDEATSALDAQSEHLVQQALARLFDDDRNNKTCTIISIAHRLSTIRHSSRIAVVQDGAIVQTGTFDELRSTEGPFKELMKTQLVGNYVDDQ